MAKAVERMKEDLYQEAEREARSTSWSFDAWTKSYSLTPSTVFEYFRHSVFYDRSCNNEIIAMQQTGADKVTLMEGLEYELEANTVDCVMCHRATPAANAQCAHCGQTSASVNDRTCGNCRSSFRGHKHCPVCSFFIIKKQTRLDQVTAKLQSLYYVIGSDGQRLPRGTILAMADLQSVLRTNLHTATFAAADALPEIATLYRQRHTQFILQNSTEEAGPEESADDWKPSPEESSRKATLEENEERAAQHSLHSSGLPENEILRTEFGALAQQTLVNWVRSLPTPSR